MKRVLSIILALYAAAFSMGATAGCGTEIRVLTVFTNSAVGYAQDVYGKTMAEFVAQQLTAANAVLSNTATGVTVVNAGIRSGICCGAQQHLYYLDPTDVGALDWARSSIAMAQARDETNADITVMVTNYDPNNYPTEPVLDVPGAADSCPNGYIGPKRGLVGVNIAHAANGNVWSHELAHILCMSHAYGYVHRSGNTPSDCKVYWTLELGDDIAPTQKVFEAWYTSSSYQSTTQLQSCRLYANSLIGGTSNTISINPSNGFCVVNSSGGAYVNSAGTSQGTSYTCPVAQLIPYFSSVAATYQGLTIGDSSHNSGTVISAKAQDVSCYRNTKLAPAMRAAAFQAIM